MRLGIHLRDNDSESLEGFYFELPVTRVWWECASDDLHLQFASFEDTNIKPSENAYKGEMLIPRDAKVFREWLKSQGEKSTGRITIFSFILENGKARNKMMPPVTAYIDLVKNWVSPNRCKPRKIC